jgi:hypothetical protein
MNNKKMRLTESELQQVVENSVRRILMKEGLLKKAGDAIDRFENWTNDKLDDFHRGYDLKEGNPSYIFDVIKGDGWEPIKSRNGLKNGMNYVGVKKVRGSWFQANGLTDEKLVEDINIFLDGRGHASLYETVNDNYSILAIDAPLNLFETAEVNESIYGDDGFESTSTMDVKQQPQRSLKDEIDMAHDLWWMIQDKGEHDEDGQHCYLSDGIMFNNVELEVIHTLSGPNYPMVVFGKNQKGYNFDKLPYEVQQQIFNDVKEYDPYGCEEEFDLNDDDYDLDDDDELYESFNMGGSDMVRFYLNSPMNGRQVITVPFEEFANAKYKNDYLWEKASEQGNIRLMRNGYFEVDPNDPHKAEVDRIF